MDYLKQFYDQPAVRDTVKAFLLEHVNQYAVTKVLNREDTSGVADAKDIIEAAFSDLMENFKSVKVTGKENQAR